MSSEEVQKIVIQIIDYDGLCGFLSKANYADAVTTYQMPNKASSYVDDAASLVELLVEYHKSEDDKWRVKKEQTVELTTKDNVCVIGKTRTLFDVSKVFAIATLNSFFVVPGPKSISQGGFNPSEVIQLSNLIAVKPLMLMLDNKLVDEEKDVWMLTATFKG